METLNHFDTKAGTIGGTLTGIVANLHFGDFARTALLAVVGAVVSFSVSYLLGMLTKKRK